VKEARKEELLSNPIQHQKARQQKDFFWKCFVDTNAGKALSDIERSDYNLAGTYHPSTLYTCQNPFWPFFCSTSLTQNCLDTSFSKPPSQRVGWGLEDLSALLEEFVPALKAAPPKDAPKGSPQVIVLTVSAYRCIDMIKCVLFSLTLPKRT